MVLVGFIAQSQVQNEKAYCYFEFYCSVSVFHFHFSTIYMLCFALLYLPESDQVVNL